MSMAKYLLLLALLIACVSAQLLPHLQNALTALYSGNIEKADFEVKQINNLSPGASSIVDALDTIMGLDMTKHVPKYGIEAAYVSASQGTRFLLRGNSAIAAKLFVQSVSKVKAFHPRDQLNYLYIEFIIRFICQRLGFQCARSETVTTPELLDAFSRFVDNAYPLPLNLPPMPDNLAPIIYPAFKDLLTAVVKGDEVGATDILNQIDTNQRISIGYANTNWISRMGYDPQYLHPYGLFAVVDRINLVIEAVKGGDVRNAVREFNNILTLNPCINGLLIFQPKSIESMAGYISGFFNYPTLFQELYFSNIVAKTGGISPDNPSFKPQTLVDAASNCKAAADKMS